MKVDKKIIYQVRQNLWRRDYRVRDVSDTALGFHLLVQGKFRVKVKMHGEIMDPKGVDVVAEVAKGSGAFKGQIKILYYTPGGTFTSPSDVFGLPTSKEKHGKKETGKKEGKKARD